MSKDTISLLKIFGVTVAIFTVISSTSSGFHIRDTYFIMGNVTKVVIFLVFSTFIGSLVASILSKFRNKFYVRALIFSTLLLFSASIYIFSLFAKPH